MKSEKARRTGWILVLVVLGLTIYSLMVIRSRGRLPEPQNLSPKQRLWRGL